MSLKSVVCTQLLGVVAYCGEVPHTARTDVLVAESLYM